MAEVDVSKLTGEQLDGMACVVCKHVFSGAERPTAVGHLGPDQHPVYACPRPCTQQVPELITESPVDTP
jgi:hypothetical protein